jgi:hypothetical protein
MSDPTPDLRETLHRLLRAAALGLQFVEEYAATDRPLANIARKAARETEAALLDAATLMLREPCREPTDLELVRAEAERMKDPPSCHWYPRSRDALALLRTVVRLAEKGE